MTAGVHAVAAGAVAFFVHMKAMFCIRLETAYFADDTDLVAGLHKTDTATGRVA